MNSSSPGAPSFLGVEPVDDYGHHPSEIDAVIERSSFQYKSFALIFQPHRISRFTTFYDRFKAVLLKVEPLIILPVYTAGEKIRGKESAELYEELKGDGHEVYYFESLEKAGLYLKENIDKMRVNALVTAGAGDLNTIFDYLK